MKKSISIILLEILLILFTGISVYVSNYSILPIIIIPLTFLTPVLYLISKKIESIEKPYDKIFSLILIAIFLLYGYFQLLINPFFMFFLLVSVIFLVFIGKSLWYSFHKKEFFIMMIVLVMLVLFFLPKGITCNEFPQQVPCESFCEGCIGFIEKTESHGFVNWKCIGWVIEKNTECKENIERRLPNFSNQP